MLLACVEERDYWIGQIERVMMLKRMFDKGYELPTYEFYGDGIQDHTSEDLFMACVKIVFLKYGITLLPENHNNSFDTLFKAVFPIRQRYAKADKEKLAEIKQTITAFPSTGGYECGIFAKWVCHPDTPWIENVLHVEFEHFYHMQEPLGYLMDAMPLIEPYLLKSALVKGRKAS